jgi:hypothetical protein
MTEEILTRSQRLSLDELPDSLSNEDIVRYFTLSPSEISEAKALRGAENQVGFALQLCTLLLFLTGCL